MVLETIFYIDIITNNPTTGVVQDADTPPTFQVFENENDTAILSGVSVKRVGHTGNYRAKIETTTPNGFEIGKSYAVIAEAEVGGIQGKAVIANFLVEDKKVDQPFFLHWMDIILRNWRAD